jgi:hypothetical protein
LRLLRSLSKPNTLVTKIRMRKKWRVEKGKARKGEGEERALVSHLVWAPAILSR